MLFTNKDFAALPSYYFTVDSTRNKYTLHYPWVANETYHLLLKKEAFTDSAGATLARNDTLKISTKRTEDYGSVRLRFNKLDLTKNPVLQIIQNERIVEAIVLTQREWYRKLFPPGEYELRTTVAQLVTQVVGAGGSFCEIQALNFEDNVVEMGHDGPAHLAVSSHDPLLRGLGSYHGKRGYGVSVEFDVQHGPVTLLGLGQDRDGSLAFVASEGVVVPGPLLAIGNTTSRVDFERDPGEWVDEWSGTGIGHHWSLSIGHRAADYKAAASLLGIDFRQV